MFSEINTTKEEIKKSMLKNASEYWKIKKEDFDPMVKLLLDALSVELYNLVNDIKDTEVRLLEKIANLLAPEFLTCPNAAHCIIHANPAESFEVINRNAHFYTEANIFFTPVDDILLFDANISYLATGVSLNTYTSTTEKQVIARTIRGKSIENDVLWLGIDITEKMNGLNNLSFYFNLETIESLTSPGYQLLPLSKWYLGNEEINIVPGIQYKNNTEVEDAQRSLFKDYNLLSKMEKDIKSFYDHRFITIADTKFNNMYELKEKFPSEFVNYFDKNELQNLDKKLLWIKIVFPAAVQQEFLNKVYVYTNAFPAMNRKLNDHKYRLKGGSNIVPLKNSGLEQFLFVKSVSDANHFYKSIPSANAEAGAKGTYTVRSGGLERFDERNARELISYLLELLRSESSAFRVYGYDFIATTLREIDQRIENIEKETKDLFDNTRELRHYIITQPIEGNDLMYVEYWTTLAEKANNISAAMPLHQHNGAKVKADSLYLLTTTAGGKSRLKPEERLNAFRYSLITRDRIVTKEDIRNFCFYELGNRIREVRIEKGFELSGDPRRGFSRTIDVLITPVQATSLNTEEWQLLFEQLRSKLQTRSGMNNNYRILLDSLEYNKKTVQL